MSILTRMILRMGLGMVVAGAVLFIPAGTLRFWQAWIFLAFTFLIPLWATVYLYKHDPQLLERRLRTKEKVSEQRHLIRVLKPVFFAVVLLPGFDHRLGWSQRLWGAMPEWLSLLFDAVILGGLLLIFWVMKVNSFASRTIEVEAGQSVISTGPYALVRHPMYTGSLIMFLSMPLALGSYVTWPAFALLILFYVYRLLNEEKFLRRELPGYSDYCVHTRFRLVPHVW